MQLTLLQFNVQSRTSEAETVKQQLVQTALRQGLCDVAFLQRCSGIHEPTRAGVGAAFEAGCDWPTQSAVLDKQHTDHSGVMLCYRVDKFEEVQLATSAADVPGWAYKAVQLHDKSTGNTFIVVSACMSAVSTAHSQHPAALPISPFHLLMQRFSAVCPVIAVAEVTTPQGLASGISSLDQHMQICICPTVQHATYTSQVFFAALGTSPLHQVQLSNVQTVLPGPEASTVQHIHNTHTALCSLEHNAVNVTLQRSSAASSDSTQSPAESTDTAILCEPQAAAHTRLQSLFAAAAEQVYCLCDHPSCCLKTVISPVVTYHRACTCCCPPALQHCHHQQ